MYLPSEMRLRTRTLTWEFQAASAVRHEYCEHFAKKSSFQRRSGKNQFNGKNVDNAGSSVNTRARLHAQCNKRAFALIVFKQKEEFCLFSNLDFMERELRERKERYRTECEGLPHGWCREVVIRKSGHSAGRVDIYYYRWGTK